MSASIANIDDYLGTLKDDQRATLEKIRKAIRAAAPKAEECINYGMPAFRLNGVAIAGFSASAKHCSYFPMSGSTIGNLKDELEGYDTSKGAIRFPIDKPLPGTLIRKLVKARIAEAGLTSKTKK